MPYDHSLVFGMGIAPFPPFLGSCTTTFLAAPLRWTLCARDRCYKYAALTPLFRAFKTIPVDRGEGLFQPGMQAAVQRLDAGEWVHMFPEGTRTKDGSLGPTRQGVGEGRDFVEAGWCAEWLGRGG